MFVAHSLTLLPKDTALPAAAKNQSYITRRVRRDRFLEAKAMKLSTDPKQKHKFTLDEFYAYSLIEKQQQADGRPVVQEARAVAYYKTLTLRQLMKLVHDGKFSYSAETGQFEIKMEYYANQMIQKHIRDVEARM